MTYTVLDSAAPTGVDPFLRTFGQASDRFWRFRIPVGAVEAQIGELILGIPNALTRQPLYGRVSEAIVGNVARDESSGGVAWRVKKGASRTRMSYGYESLADADWATLKQALAECAEGAKDLLLQDLAGALHWVEWIVHSDGLAETTRGLGRHVVDLEFLESLA